MPSWQSLKHEKRRKSRLREQNKSSGRSKGVFRKRLKNNFTQYNMFGDTQMESFDEIEPLARRQLIPFDRTVMSSSRMRRIAEKMGKLLSRETASDIDVSCQVPVMYWTSKQLGCVSEVYVEVGWHESTIYGALEDGCLASTIIPQDILRTISGFIGRTGFAVLTSQQMYGILDLNGNIVISSAMTAPGKTSTRSFDEWKFSPPKKTMSLVAVRRCDKSWFATAMIRFIADGGRDMTVYEVQIGRFCDCGGPERHYDMSSDMYTIHCRCACVGCTFGRLRLAAAGVSEVDLRDDDAYDEIGRTNFLDVTAGRVCPRVAALKRNSFGQRFRRPMAGFLEADLYRLYFGDESDCDQEESHEEESEECTLDVILRTSCVDISVMMGSHFDQ